MKRILEFPDYDVANDGEYRTDAAHYKRKLEILGLTEEEILERMKKQAHIGTTDLAIDYLVRALGDVDKAMEKLIELLEKESEFYEEGEKDE